MATQSVLRDFSSALAGLVGSARPGVISVDDGTRLPASGIVWSADGVILATSHGVERDEDLAVILDDGGRRPATVIGRDPDTDVAALRVDGAGLTTLERAAPPPRVGDVVLAIARPRGVLNATAGIVTALEESETGGKPGYVLTTDAGFYRGFSGGAVVDADGRLVGMCNLIYGRGAGVAVGTPVLGAVAASLLEHGRVRRGYLGIRAQQVELPAGTGQSRGVLITRVEAGSPAQTAGLLLGDTLLGIDGETVEDVDDLRRILRAREPGRTVALRILRSGEAREVSAALAAEQ